MDLWRLVPRERADSAFSGEGARRFGGRWNPAGTPAVYLAEHLSLAALEILVHLPRAALSKPYLAFRVTVPDGVGLEEWAPPQLPDGWDREPPVDASQRAGAEWLARGNGLLLAVPSVIIPRERNYLINKAHADWERLTIHPPEPFSFDSRLTASDEGGTPRPSPESP